MPSFVPKMSASITSYIVQIIYIASAWILYPLHVSLLPLIYLRKITYGLCCTVSWRTDTNDSKLPSHMVDNSKVHDEYKSDNWKSAVFTDVTLYTTVNRYQEFRGAKCL